MQTFILIADMAWVKPVLAIVFMVVVGINKLLSARNNVKPQAARPRVPKPQPVPPAARQQIEQQQMQVMRDDVQREVQAFLRQAEEKKRGQAARPVPPVVRQPKSKKPSKQPSKQPPQPTAAPVARRRLGEGVAEHVAEHLQSGEFSRRAAHLTDDLARADQARQEHFARTFSHQVGRLETTATSAGPPAPTAVPSPAGARLVELLRDPTNIRSAIVMNEILNRPQW